MAEVLTKPGGGVRLSCLEIWGGNEAAESQVAVPGIDAWVICQPYAGQSGGGDIHYVSMCGAGAISRFTVADVSGHGHAVDKLAKTLRALMRKHINNLDQTSFVRTLNKEFSALAQNDAFATALLATYFAPTDHLIVCNAGHPTPLWRRAGPGTWHFLRHDIPEHLESFANLPLGVIHPTSYYQFAVPLAPGDLILVYTDSLIEARNARGEQLGERGLLELVGRLNIQTPAVFGRDLLETVRAYRDFSPAEDDVTILLMHHTAANPPRQSFGEKMKVLGKVLGLIKI